MKVCVCVGGVLESSLRPQGDVFVERSASSGTGQVSIKVQSDLLIPGRWASLSGAAPQLEPR